MDRLPKIQTPLTLISDTSEDDGYRIEDVNGVRIEPSAVVRLLNQSAPNTTFLNVEKHPDDVWKKDNG